MKALTISEQRLREAITSCRIYQTRQLLETGTPAEYIDEEGLTPLLRAIRIEDEKHRTRSSLIKLLLQYQANVNATDPEGRHALSYACITQKLDLIKLLLDTSIHNLDLNLKDNEGDTPLMHAVRVGNLEIVQILVDNLNRFQINMDVRNKDDRTPYLEAKRLGMEECATVLLDEGHASRNIQVNPFLDFLDNNDTIVSHGKIRSMSITDRLSSSRTRNMPKNQKNSNQRHSRVERVMNTKGTNDYKRLMKRKASSPRSLRVENQENLVLIQEPKGDEPGVTEGSTFGNDLEKKQELENRIVLDIVEPELNRLAPALSSRPLSGRSDSATLISVTEPPVHVASRPHTVAQARGTKKTFLTSGFTDNTEELQKNQRARHNRAKTAPGRTFEERRRASARSGALSGLHTTMNVAWRYSPKGVQSVNSATNDFERCSWYSHFSINTSPSVAFLHKMMTLYAEQHCSESSYRPGYKFVPAEQSPEICSTPDSELDRQSVEGRRSSNGTIRSVLSAHTGGRSRKFSAISRSVSPFLHSSSRKAAGSSAGSRGRSTQLS